MTTVKPIEILFDAKHNEEVILTEPELSQLVNLMEINRINAETLTTSSTTEALSDYHVVVLGNPLDSSFTPEEVSAIVNFVNSGGGLLLLSGATIFGKGGDSARNTNLNMIANHFRFEFSDKSIGVTQMGAQNETNINNELILAVPVTQHHITEGIRHLSLTSGTSIRMEDTSKHLFRVTDTPSSPTVVIATKGKKGRILAMGSTTPFFNDHIRASDHQIFIIQAIRWLGGISTTEPINQLVYPTAEVDEAPPIEAIEDLRQQLAHFEKELNNLKELISTQLKDMEKIIREMQEKEK